MTRMIKSSLEDFVGGWIVGNFDPSLLRNTQVEVCVKYFKAGDTEPEHYQKTATEVSVVVVGMCRIGGELLHQGEILLIPPQVSADFVAETDCVVLAIKSPSIPEDKILGLTE